MSPLFLAHKQARLNGHGSVPIRRAGRSFATTAVPMLCSFRLIACKRFAKPSGAGGHKPPRAKIRPPQRNTNRR